MSTVPEPRRHYAAAGRRHLTDGWLLLRGGSRASADHLAGLAGECVIKAVLLHFLGGHMAGTIPATTGSGGRVVYKHLPRLWDQVALHAQGRTGSQFAALIATPNPYTEWDIADRYLDGSSIRLVATVRHLRAADRLLRLYQRAELDGALP